MGESSKMNNLGKKIYRSSSLGSIKVVVLSIFFILLFNAYFQTYSDPTFREMGHINFRGVINFHFKYPHELILFILTVLIPCFYYTFVRATLFFEKGVVINRGLPFFRMILKYDQINYYEIIHPKSLVSVRVKETEDDYMFSVKDMDRVLAIFDQNNIKGDLGQKARVDKSSHLKLAMIIILIGILISIIQYLGLVRVIFR